MHTIIIDCVWAGLHWINTEVNCPNKQTIYEFFKQMYKIYTQGVGGYERIIQWSRNKCAHYKYVLYHSMICAKKVKDVYVLSSPSLESRMGGWIDGWIGGQEGGAIFKTSVTICNMYAFIYKLLISCMTAQELWC